MGKRLSRDPVTVEIEGSNPSTPAIFDNRIGRRFLWHILGEAPPFWLVGARVRSLAAWSSGLGRRTFNPDIKGSNPFAATKALSPATASSHARNARGASYR